MRNWIRINFLLVVLCVAPINLIAQTSWTIEQEQIVATIDRLSATTAPDGNGADDYGMLLDEAFSRWTVGSDLVSYKRDWVDGIRDWFDDGWRVSERKTDYVAIDIVDNFAFTRRNVSETYLGPDGDSSTSKAAVAEVWKKSGNSWLLLVANVHPITD